MSRALRVLTAGLLSLLLVFGQAPSAVATPPVQATKANDDTFTVYLDDGLQAVLDVRGNDQGSTKRITGITQADNTLGTATVHSGGGEDRKHVDLSLSGTTGTLSFSYTLTGDDNKFSTANVTVYVYQRPVANDDQATAYVGEETQIFVLANDVPGYPIADLTIDHLEGLNHGTVRIAPDKKSVYYTPDPNHTNNIGFYYTLSGTGHGDKAWVSIAIAPRRATLTITTVSSGGPETSFQPTVSGTAVTVPANGSSAVKLVAGSYAIGANAPSGYTAQISGVDPSGKVTVTAGGTATVTITYTYTTKGTVTVNTVKVNGPAASFEPSVGGTPVTVAADGHQDVTDLEAGSYLVTANAPSGYTAAVSGVDQSGKVTVTAGQTAAVTITYTYTTKGAVTVNTVKVNGPAASFEPSVGGTPVTVTADGHQDVTDLEAGSYLVTANAPSGYTAAVSGVDQSGKVTVTAGQTAAVTITYTYTTKGTVTVNTVKVNGPAASFEPSVGGTPVTVAAGGHQDVTDLEAGSYLVTANAPSGYTAQISGVDQSGKVTVTAGGTATVKITYTYAPQPGPGPEPEPQPNRAPVAVNDTATTAYGNSVTITVLQNDSDADGDPLTVAVTTAPANGATQVVNGQIIYTPNAGFSGEDSFTYTISDGRGGTATATVRITVAAQITPPSEPEVIIDEPIPGGSTTLPKTGGADPMMFYGVGLAAVVLGAALRKRNDEE